MSRWERAAEEWISDHPAARHLARTRDWALVLAPDAGEALRIAALTHDVERRVPGGPRHDPSSQAWDDENYLLAHGERSAQMVRAWLTEEGAPEQLGAQVADLVRVHELGGQPEADVLQAADSLSFLEVQRHRPIAWVREGRCDAAKAQAKLDWMRDRITLPAARELSRPLHEQASAALRVAITERG